MNIDLNKPGIDPVPKTLDDWLQDVQVHSPGLWENDLSDTVLLRDWWAVSTGRLSIIGYFYDGRDAYRFRLDYINRQLNP